MKPIALRGLLLPAVPVPFDSQARLHLAAHEAYERYLLSHPIRGVAVWAHTGRGLRLDPAEADRVLHRWRSALGPDRILVAGAGPRGTPRNPEHILHLAAEMARRASSLGADALLAHPPAALASLPDANDWILRYHDAIASSGFPQILFYLYEAAGGLAYDPDLLTRLLRREDVLGIKVATLDSVMTYQDLAARMATHCPDKILVTGEDRFLGYSALLGAQAALIGMGAAFPDLQARLLQAAWDRQGDAFLRLNPLVDELARHTFRAPMEGYIQRMLRCLAILGVIPAEAAHDPWGPPLDAGDLADLDSFCLRLISQQEVWAL